jgi:uncharacterized membrane protein YgdD (TMEM256/DUF423 family)
VSSQAKALIAFASLSLLVATIGGAAASHALTGVDAAQLRAFETAVDFQFFHALGLLAVTSLGERHANAGIWLAAWLLVAGTLLFCGSIYATTFGAPRWVGSAAPVGGVAFMAAWALLALAVIFGGRGAPR